MHNENHETQYMYVCTEYKLRCISKHLHAVCVRLNFILPASEIEGSSKECDPPVVEAAISVPNITIIFTYLLRLFMISKE